jgi:hypothetical protein
MTDSAGRRQLFRVAVMETTAVFKSSWVLYRVPLIIMNDLKFSLTPKPFRRHPGDRCKMLVIPAFVNPQI